MKILIWDKGIPLKNTGGPAGYLYNIHEYLKTHSNKQIDFYSDVIPSSNDHVIVNSANNNNNFIQKLLSHRVMQFLYNIYVIYYKKNRLSNDEIGLINKYDFIHVHSFGQYISSFAERSGICAKVILTTHCPEPCFDEICGLFQFKKLFSTFLSPIRSHLIKKECKELEKTDLFLIPVQEATEAYTLVSKHYTRLFKKIDSKLVYVPTSIYPSDAILTDSNPIKDVPICAEDLKVCFIGRHNTIKGYDQLKLIAQKSTDNNIKAHYIIGGKEEPLTRLNSSKWTELGWVDTMAVLNNIDVFILPNKQTYFDLILIEVLRQGKVCIISNTGGNKWFSQFKDIGVYMYEYGDIDSAINIIASLQQIKETGGLRTLEQKNRDFFTSQLTMSNYISNYCSQLNSLLKSSQSKSSDSLLLSSD